MNNIMNKNDCLEVLTSIAFDTNERATERIKAIELLTKISDDNDDWDGMPNIIDDIV